jgi:hypothetical protein
LCNSAVNFAKAGIVLPVSQQYSMPSRIARLILNCSLGTIDPRAERTSYQMWATFVPDRNNRQVGALAYAGGIVGVLFQNHARTHYRKDGVRPE